MTELKEFKTPELDIILFNQGDILVQSIENNIEETTKQIPMDPDDYFDL